MYEVTFAKMRLITRDDKERFTDGNSSFSKSEAEIENLRKAERIVLQQTGGVVTKDTQGLIERELLKLNFCRKTLDALAGGDDTLFVILDDRCDVWQSERKNPRSNLVELVESENLFRIPAYYYFPQSNLKEYSDALWFEKILR